MARKRKPIPPETQNAVLLKSRRRCCLCFWLKGINEVRKGQIAHLDHNHDNHVEDNLVFLCFDHHDEYDGRTSTSKGFREDEVREYGNRLYRETERTPGQADTGLAHNAREAVQFLHSHLRMLQERYETLQNLLPQDLLPVDDTVPETSEDEERCARLADQLGFDGNVFRNLFPLHPESDGVDFASCRNDFADKSKRFPVSLRRSNQPNGDLHALRRPLAVAREEGSDRAAVIRLGGG